jgi:hypothetical protein
MTDKLDYAQMALDIKFAQGYMHAMGVIHEDSVVAMYANKLSWVTAHLMEISEKKTNAADDEKELAREGEKR